MILKLKRNNLVFSSRGPTGGYFLSKSPEEIKLSSIIKAVDEKVAVEGNNEMKKFNSFKGQLGFEKLFLLQKVVRKSRRASTLSSLNHKKYQSKALCI